MGFTYLCWTFVDLTQDQIALPVHSGFRRHEQRHVMQSVLITVGYVVGALAMLATGGGTAWSLLGAPFVWPLVYWAASVVAKIRTGRGYTDNWFELDARRYEERTR